MKRNLDIEIRNLDGTPVELVIAKRPEDVKIVPDDAESAAKPATMTMANAISEALIMSKPDGTNAKENITRYHLAKKVYEGGVQEFTTEDIALAKRAVGAVFGPLVIGQVADWCEADMAKDEPAATVADTAPVATAAAK